MLHAKNGSQLGEYEYKKVFHFPGIRTIPSIIVEPGIKTSLCILLSARKKEGFRVWHVARTCFEVIFLKNFLHTVVLVFMVARLGISLSCSRGSISCL